MRVANDADRLPWAAAWRIARRDLSARFRGLRLLLACLFLGTAALTAIGTLTAAVERELAANGAELLGGDIQVSVWQRPLSDAEASALAALGTVSGGTRLQAVARAEEATAPVEVKAVDAAYPLYGALVLTDGRTAGAPPPGDAWLAQGALDRLGIEVGDTFTLGLSTLRAAGVIAAEPDRLGEGFQLGPTIIVAENLPAQAGLLAPGAMYRTKVRVAFDPPRDAAPVAETLEQRFADSGLEVRTRDRASPGADRFVTQMGDFLTLVGLAALVIAGIGIGGGVASYLQSRRGAIATLKVLGAGSADTGRIYALQIGAAALIGSVAGVVAGIAVTPLLARALAGVLPVRSGVVADPGAIVLALAYSLLVAAIFTASPLLAARRTPAMALMRGAVAEHTGDRKAIMVVAGGVALLVALVLLTSVRPALAAGFMAASALAMAILAGLALLLRRAARRAPSPASPLTRLAVANLARPGSNLVALVTALGFGLSAFVLLAAVQTSIAGNIERRVPQQAPDYFVLDIPQAGLPAFSAAVRAVDPDAQIRAVPNLRGAILAYGPPDAMTRVSALEEVPDGAWALRGERGLTYAETLPPGNRLVEGTWWSADHAGERLVSVDEDLARAIGLRVGDRLSVGVLGTEITATVANLRQIDWDSLGFNHVLVFSPNTLRDAPHTLSATLGLNDGADRRRLLQTLVQQFPASSVIEVGEVLQQARLLLDQIGLATLAAASVAVLAGLVVLVGAMAAARAARVYDTVILRVLGADRRQILLLQALEFGILTAVLAVIALAIGAGTAWLVITQLFSFDWLPDWGTVLSVLVAGLVVVLVFATAGSLPFLRARPAQALRTL
ncbi:FtsX-like permease family protein [Erythrobacteraceae bacterium CFH 75059]|uniref:ABC transporter permease n=1 Tax=Qipengyuania thermophila TaxID=2509361 RepID=UPI001021223B|nr:FtsX-like permease family protein [Qipengyuania thermophila]TCD06355.1 FtsX-like permease family protein [Erythrobacteraceae bacterium CFH 75059]